MKFAKWLTGWRAVVFAAVSGAVAASGKTATVGGVEWTYIEEDGKATISGEDSWSPAISTSTSGKISIPAKLGGVPVVELGFNALRGCSLLTAVTVPGSVKNIGMCAFYDCSGLTKATISNGVARIDEYAFCWCTNLTKMSIPASVTFLGMNAFADCTRLKTVTLPSGLTKIPAGLFYNCTSLTNAAIPSGVTEIGEEAFAGCASMKTMKIPDSVGSLGRQAFDGCAKLATLSVPGAWYGTAKIPESGVPESCKVTYRGLTNGTSTVDGVKWTYGVVGGRATVTGASPAEGNLSIPAKLGGAPVAAIGSGMFSGCTGLTGVAFPDSVRTIGDRAFYGCSALEEVTIPESVESFGNEAFYDCTGLKKVSILGNVTDDWEYWKSPFYGCTNLKTVVLGEGMTKIGVCMFHGCTGLESVTIPAGVSSIGTEAFDSCDALAEMTILGNVTNDWGCWSLPFAECTNLKTVVLGDAMTKIGDFMFCDCTALEELTIPGGVTSVGQGAFSDCSGLKTLYVPAEWEGTEMLAEAEVPPGCTVVYGTGPAAGTTSTGVPHAWLESYGLGDGTAAGYEAAAAEMAENGRPVWECYVAGLDPTKEGEELKVLSVDIVDGEVVWTCEPDWSGAEGEKRREYHVEGATSMKKGDWTDLRGRGDVETGGWRYFRVAVEVPK